MLTIGSRGVGSAPWGLSCRAADCPRCSVIYFGPPATKLEGHDNQGESNDDSTTRDGASPRVVAVSDAVYQRLVADAHR